MSLKQPFGRTWGLTHDEWEEARERMQDLLVSVAACRKTITYGECVSIVFAGRFSPRSTALAQMLEEVCTIEDAARGVMLGSVVVRKDSGIPGDGYFAFAEEELGRDLTDRRGFWESEVSRVWDAFQETAR